MPLTLRDGLSGRRRRVVPRRGLPLTMYVCGPTVYAPAHVGHARTYLYFDVLRRTVEEAGVRVRHVMNITDLEDKITDRARRLRQSWTALARREERGFLSDLAALRIRPPTIAPRASEFVPRMVEVARRLERTGHVRRTESGWVFDPPASHAARNFPSGAALSAHVVPEPGHPFEGAEDTLREFLVWKPQAPPEPSFPSPWGPGVPGWHLECYTMAQDLLGVPVDLHGGGTDLVFPHHYAENEVALTLDRGPFARTFVHTAFVLQNGSKMSKSTGNLVPLRPTVEAAGPDALRWYLLSPPFFERLSWHPEGLESAGREHARVRAAFRFAISAGQGGSVPGRAVAGLAANIRYDLEEDLGTDRALRRLRTFADHLERAGNGRLARGDRPGAVRAIASIEALLGLTLR